MAKKLPATRGAITAKVAAENAARYLVEIAGRVANVTIEEVELSDDDRYWFITLSYIGSNPSSFMMKEYKVFKLDSSSGKVRSMKIREV